MLVARRTLWPVAAALPIALAFAGAQQATDYALTNARIVTAPGKVIDKGTVLIQGGKITAVGARVTVPSGVTTLDANGQTVFPGLIDAATSIGLPNANRTAADTGGGGRRGGGGAPAAGGGARGGGNPNEFKGPLAVGGDSLPRRDHTINPATNPGAEATSVFAPTPDQLKSLRAGGVTTVGLAFQGGIFPGRIGAALTGGQNESQLSLKSSAAQQVVFGMGRGGYPNTGIGSYAYVRQAILDGQYEARIQKAMKAGASAPAASNDPFVKALAPAGANEMPTWFVASTERQINRVADAVKELGLKNAAILGSQEGWRVIPAFKSSATTAIVSLDWPAPNSVTGVAFTDMAAAGGGRGGGGGGGGRGGAGGGGGGGAAAMGPEGATLRANAAALAKAGVPVVLASYGGESGATFRDRIRMTIEAGMSADDALRAVTMAPAALLGISDQVGTIEVGKMANLVVVDGNDLFAAGSPIKRVFVQGRLY